MSTSSFSPALCTEFVVARPEVEVPSEDGMYANFEPGPDTFVTITVRVGKYLYRVRATNPHLERFDA